MSRQQNQRQQQQEESSDENYAQQQKKYLCTAPKPEVWDDYSDSVYKSLLRMAAAKDLKKSKKKKEHQKTRVGAIRITKIAIADIEVTLDKTRNFHHVKNERSGPGRKSNAEHAIHFYEHILERLQDRLSKLQNSNSIKDITTGDVSTTDNTDGKSNTISIIFQDYDITPLQNPGPKITPTSRKGNGKTNEAIKSNEKGKTNEKVKLVEKVKIIEKVKTNESKITPNTTDKTIKTTPAPTSVTGTSSISTRKRSSSQRDEEAQTITFSSDKKSTKKTVAADVDDDDQLDNDLSSPGSLFGRNHASNKNVCVVCFDDKPPESSDNASNTTTTTLLDCSVCEYKFHVSCLRPAIDEVPEEYNSGSWKCPYCILQVEPKNSSTRKHAAKGVRLMARLRNRFDREKKQNSKQQQRSVKSLSTGDTPATPNPADDTSADEKGVTQDEMDQDNQSPDDNMQSEVDCSSIDSSTKRNAKHDSKDSLTQLIDKDLETVKDHVDNNTQNGRFAKDNDVEATRQKSVDDEKAKVDSDSKEDDTPNTRDQGESSSANSSSKKRINLELAKLMEAAAFSPSSSKRVKKKPRLYDPQVCAASSWKSDATIDWSTQSDEDETIPPTVPADESSSTGNKDAAKHVDYTRTTRSERGNNNTAGAVTSTEVTERKTIRNKNSSLCAFCHDDPDVVVCCFCACRVCFGKHNQGMLLLCDMCDDEYHTYCLQPPLSAIPATKWFCPSCSNAENKTDDVTSSESVKAQGRVGKQGGSTTSSKVKSNRTESPTKKASTPAGSSAKELNFHTPKVKEFEEKNSSRQSTQKSSKEKTSDNRTKSSSDDVADAALTQPRKRGRPRKNPVEVPDGKKSMDSAANKKKVEVVTTKKSVEKSATSKANDVRARSEISSIKSGPPLSNGPVLVSRSGRMVKRTNFHDELFEGEQHLRASIRSASFSQETTDVGSMSGVEEIIPKRQPKRSASVVTERTSISGKRGVQSKASTSPAAKSAPVQSYSIYDEIKEAEEKPPAVNLLHESMPDVLMSPTLTNVLEHDIADLDFINQMQLSAEDIDAIAMQTVTDEHILHQVHGSINNDSMALDIDEHEVNLLSSFESSQIESEQQVLQLPLMKDESPVAHNNVVNAPQFDVATLQLDQAPVNQPFGLLAEIPTSAATMPTITVQSEDLKEGRDSAKLPRRKPGARECMQISRRFGVGEIPQRYMDILMDYCSRGKVEHLIRMRERLDEHARFLESQLAGLEVLVQKNGESDVVVPIASQMPGYKAHVEKDNDGFP